MDDQGSELCTGRGVSVGRGATEGLFSRAVIQCELWEFFVLVPALRFLGFIGAETVLQASVLLALLNAVPGRCAAAVDVSGFSSCLVIVRWMVLLLLTSEL